MAAKVAFHNDGGAAGDLVQRAARHFLVGDAESAPSPEAVAFASAELAFVAVKSGEAELAAVPFESSRGGSIHAHYDLLLKHALHIVGEYDLRVSSASTNDFTRFLLLSNKEDLGLDRLGASSNDKVQFKTSLVFAFADLGEQGMLTRALSVFAQHKLHMTKIESRPWDGHAPHQPGHSLNDKDGMEDSAETQRFQYIFFLDILGHLTDRAVVSALRDLSKFSRFVRILGSYATNGKLLVEAHHEPEAEAAVEPAEKTMEEKYPLNAMFSKVTVPQTVFIHAKTKQMEAEGQQVWSLCVGEPDYSPPERVLTAGKLAMERGDVKYAHMKGTVELRGLVSEYLETVKGLKYDPATEVLISNGGQQAVYQALYAVCNPGEKVLIPTPYWLNYPEIVKLVHAEPVALRTTIAEQYLINPRVLEETLTANPETKVIILCNPSNPSGSLHSPAHLEKIAAVLRKPAFQHVLVISDEIYEQLIYQDEGEETRVHQSFATLPGMYERTLTVNGFSKAYAMTGMRVGYLAAPKYFIDACTLLQAQLTSCANTTGQIAACEAIKVELECHARGEPRITEVMKNLDEKRRYIVGRLRAMPGVEFAYPTAAFYVFLDLSAHFQNRPTRVVAKTKEPLAGVDAFCAYLLREFNVAVVPGSEFGDVYGMRISYASSMDAIRHAMDGMETLLLALE